MAEKQVITFSTDLFKGILREMKKNLESSNLQDYSDLNINETKIDIESLPDGTKVLVKYSKQELIRAKEIKYINDKLIQVVENNDTISIYLKDDENIKPIIKNIEKIYNVVEKDGKTYLFCQGVTINVPIVICITENGDVLTPENVINDSQSNGSKKEVHAEEAQNEEINIATEPLDNPKQPNNEEDSSNEKMDDVSITEDTINDVQSVADNNNEVSEVETVNIATEPLDNPEQPSVENLSKEESSSSKKKKTKKRKY